MNQLERNIPLEENTQTDKSGESQFNNPVSNFVKFELPTDKLNSPTKEHLGKFSLSNESNEKNNSQKPNVFNQLSPNQIETMNRVDLIALAEHVEIEGTTLRRIFETKLIGENAVRRIMKEYLKNGDLNKLLKQEILEHEMDFERDPAIRDISNNPGDLQTDQLNTFSEVESTSQQLINNQEKINEFNTLQQNQLKQNIESKYKTKSSQQIKKLDATLSLIVGILIFAIILLLIIKR